MVQDASQMVLQLTFPAADAAHFSVGQAAQITLDGTFEVLNGTVTDVSGSDILSTGNVLVRNVTITTPQRRRTEHHPSPPPPPSTASAPPTAPPLITASSAPW